MPASLTLADFSDADLLYALDKAADEEGWASAKEVVKEIGDIGLEHPARGVGSRLSWQKRYGLMETKREKGETYWRLNEIGHALLAPRKLTAVVERALGGLDEGQRVRVADAIARAIPTGSRQAGHLTTRAFRHGLGGWRDPKIAGGQR